MSREPAMQRTLRDTARMLGGELLGAEAAYTSGADIAYSSVSSDSRTLDPGALFVALRGPNFDGGEFVADAAARGAVAALVERRSAVSLPQIVVPDALRGLQRLAQAWRAEFEIPIVGVAGSNGKTTVKEMTAAILSRMGPCMATRGNLNNHIGVPLTLLRLTPAHRSAVIEVGANRVGEVAELAALARPTVGIITNAGAEHLEFFGDLDGVARGEGEMVAGLPLEGTAIINGDDAYCGYWRRAAGAARVVTFGVAGGPAVGGPAVGRPDFSAQETSHTIEHGEFATRFTLVCPLGERRILLKAGGSHNVSNALAAAAAACAAGASLDAIEAGLAVFRPVSGRLNLQAGMQGSWLIDDSYNANPSSVRAGLEVLHSLSGRTWLVLGDMMELGGHAADSHADMGRLARARGVQRLFAMGPLSRGAVESFGAGGEWFADAESLIPRLRAQLEPGVTVLIKGSRVNRLERVVLALRGVS